MQTCVTEIYLMRYACCNKYPSSEEFAAGIIHMGFSPCVHCLLFRIRIKGGDINQPSTVPSFCVHFFVALAPVFGNFLDLNCSSWGGVYADQAVHCNFCTCFSMKLHPYLCLLRVPLIANTISFMLLLNILMFRMLNDHKNVLLK